MNKKQIEKIFQIDFDVEIQNIEIDEEKQKFLPKIDEHYQFDEEITKSILAGFAYNKKVLVYGLHGSGKSTHIEQIATRINWPCIRMNLDSHIGRIDFIGRDAITLKDGKQITEFKNGILPWAMENGIALILDEYDAGRPEVMFVLQRVLENEGKLTLTEENKVINPHKDFRIFATANTIGIGDETGLYHGTNLLNQGQLDRWDIIVKQNYMNEENEIRILIAKIPKLKKKQDLIEKMVTFANLTRKAFENGDLSVLISPRSLIAWAENYLIFGDIIQSLKLSFLNRCSKSELDLANEFYQRSFGKELR